MSWIHYKNYEGTEGVVDSDLFTCIPIKVDLAVAGTFKTSRSEAERLRKQGAIEIDGEPVTDPIYYAVTQDLKAGVSVRVGKRWLRWIL